MKKFIIEKTINMIISLFTVLTLTFFMLEFLPGTPLSYLGKNIESQSKENYLEHYNLNEPILKKYVSFTKNIFFHRDLGESMIYPGRKVIDEIKRYGVKSFSIGIKGIILGIFIGGWIGIASITVNSRLIRNIMIIMSILMVSIPSFIVATLLYYIFVVKLTTLSTLDLGGENILLPVVCVAISTAGIYAKYFREGILEELHKDYVLQARAKGNTNWSLLKKHILKNALFPMIALVLPQIAGIFIGFYVIESIFSVPGFGTVYIDSINNRDYNMILGATLIFTISYIISVYVAELLFLVADPRLRRKNG
ncbi:ABC transporter permease [uncultured Ilyobacter sp.]|uniref:ABC transporter permease n=1 Tax=uncultured Ilyobacter sp. TaxID=544433 RepID=UPI0029C8E0C1|nr:ABC transporter permease [uncultured Ilyobacter sp.]